MKKIISTFILALILTATISKAQTAMQLNGMDCNGVSHDLFADLDAGKAVILHFFMPSCGSCPPPAQKIQAMANNILSSYPGMITAYAMPFNNTTTCVQTASWVSSNSLSLYSPYDSGAVQVANYGGFGMPTVVLLGGTDHRIMFSSLAFSTSDTTIMRDSILALFGAAPAGIHESHLPSSINSLSIYPNPASNHTMITMDLNEATNLAIDVIDITGRQVAIICNEKNKQGTLTKHFNTDALANGTYTIRINANGKFANKKLNVVH
jgi:hypothetical protein